MFYEVYSRLCSQRGEAETSVCRKLNISSASPKFWREGKKPRPSTIKKIADYFGVDVSFFDEPFPEAPLPEEPKYIPVQVITSEESQMLTLYGKLTEQEKAAVFTLIEMLGRK